METVKEKEGIKEKAEDILSHGVDYLDTFYKLGLVKVTRKATQIASASISAIVILTFGMFVLFFAGLGLGWWLGDVVNSRTGGFLLVALFYFIIAMALVLMSKKIVFPYIRDLLIRKSHDQ